MLTSTKKRLFDLILATIGLIILTPLFLFIGLRVKLSSPGPILYTQQRVGLKGKVFRLYKFRSMVANADQLGTSITTARDPRTTDFGRFLRRTKLDELPQFWNVLKGDMSLVGPRPDVPEIVATYTDEMRHVLDIRPGITSVASLYLRDEEVLLTLFVDPNNAYITHIVPAKVNLAMEHVRRNSFWFDQKIFFLTVWALTLGRLWGLPDHPMVQSLRLTARNANCKNRSQS